MHRLRAVAAASLCLCLVAVPTVALAGTANPKHGYFIDPKWSVYVVVGASRTSLTSLQAPCFIKSTSGGSPSQQGGFSIPKSKHPKISNAGKFTFKGNVTLQTGSKYVTKVKVTGTFANGKVKGVVTFLDTKVTCLPVKYTGKFYGVNPQG
jgi:hypothetical protein